MRCRIRAYLVGVGVHHAVGSGPEGADPLRGHGPLVLRVGAQLQRTGRNQLLQFIQLSGTGAVHLGQQEGAEKRGDQGRW